MKKILLWSGLTLITLVPLISAAQVNADTAARTRTQALEEYRQAQTENRVTQLHSLGDTLIANRLSSLNRVAALLTDAPRLSTRTVTELQNTITSNRTRLEALNVTIAANNDIDSLKTQVHSVVTDFRIYAVVLPQAHGFAAVDRLQNFAETLTDVNDRVLTKVAALQNAGTPTGDVLNLTSSATANISNAKNALSEAQSLYASMQVADPDAARQFASQGREKLQQTRTELREAQTTITTAVATLKEIVADAHANETREE